MPLDKETLQRLRDNDSTLTKLYLGSNQISDVGAQFLADALVNNTSLTHLNLGDSEVSNAIREQIGSLIHRNQRYLQKLKTASCEQLKVGRVLLYKAKAAEEGNSIVSKLPLKIREIVIKQIDKNASLMTDEQQRLILDYAEGRISSVADKLTFFRVTKCGRIRKSLQVSKQTVEPPAKRICLSLS